MDRTTTKFYIIKEKGSRSQSFLKEAILFFSWVELNLASLTAQHLQASINIQVDFLIRKPSWGMVPPNQHFPTDRCHFQATESQQAHFSIEQTDTILHALPVPLGRGHQPSGISVTPSSYLFLLDNVSRVEGFVCLPEQGSVWVTVSIHFLCRTSVCFSSGPSLPCFWTMKQLLGSLLALFF